LVRGDGGWFGITYGDDGRSYHTLALSPPELAASFIQPRRYQYRRFV
jgi:hypothetical protein